MATITSGITVSGYIGLSMANGDIYRVPAGSYAIVSVYLPVSGSSVSTLAYVGTPAGEVTLQGAPSVDGFYQTFYIGANTYIQAFVPSGVGSIQVIGTLFGNG